MYMLQFAKLKIKNKIKVDIFLFLYVDASLASNVC